MLNMANFLGLNLFLQEVMKGSALSASLVLYLGTQGDRGGRESLDCVAVSICRDQQPRHALGAEAISASATFFSFLSFFIFYY